MRIVGRLAGGQQSGPGIREPGQQVLPGLSGGQLQRGDLFQREGQQPDDLGQPVGLLTRQLVAALAQELDRLGTVETAHLDADVGLVVRPCRVAAGDDDMAADGRHQLTDLDILRTVEDEHVLHLARLQPGDHTRDGLLDAALHRHL